MTWADIASNQLQWRYAGIITSIWVLIIAIWHIGQWMRRHDKGDIL